MNTCPLRVANIQGVYMPFGILARAPLASGALSGHWTRQTKFTRDDWRAAVFTGEELERTLGYVDAVRFLEETGHSLAEMAIRFAFSDPAVSAAIWGRATHSRRRR
jgi:aryl-alcohol dehydrogenase-like predicted oxidoreductase